MQLKKGNKIVILEGCTPEFIAVEDNHGTHFHEYPGAIPLTCTPRKYEVTKDENIEVSTTRYALDNNSNDYRALEPGPRPKNIIRR